jgi:hypothetical protein
MITGTLKWPAMAALMPASDTEAPCNRTSASLALDIVWARTPRAFVVPVW